MSDKKWGYLPVLNPNNPDDDGMVEYRLYRRTGKGSMLVLRSDSHMDIVVYTNHIGGTQGRLVSVPNTVEFPHYDWWTVGIDRGSKEPVVLNKMRQRHDLSIH